MSLIWPQRFKNVNVTHHSLECPFNLLHWKSSSHLPLSFVQQLEQRLRGKINRYVCRNAADGLFASLNHSQGSVTVDIFQDCRSITLLCHCDTAVLSILFYFHFRLHSLPPICYWSTGQTTRRQWNISENQRSINCNTCHKSIFFLHFNT